MSRVPEAFEIATPYNMDAARLCNLFSYLTDDFPCIVRQAPRFGAVYQIDGTPEIVRALAETGFREAAREGSFLLVLAAHDAMRPQGHHVLSHALD